MTRTIRNSAKFKLEPVPKEQFGEFYTGDAYICLYCKNRDEWDVHFWLGEHATTDEVGVAAIKTVELDQNLGGFPVQHREVQNHESSLFLSYFPNGISGGYESGYKHVEDMFENWKPQLFHCKGKRNVRCIQVDLDVKSLNLGDVFILDLGRDIYVWIPPDSGRLERIKGMSHAKNIASSERQGRSTVHILDKEWNNDEVFFSYFGGLSSLNKIAKARNDDENYWRKTVEEVSLYRVSDQSGSMKITKLPQVKQSELKTEDAFILDAVNGGVFIWIGKQCTLFERANAISWGENYLRQKPLLYQVSEKNGALAVEEISNFNQESLDGDDVMILDALSTIFVWVGAGATTNEKEGAMSTAQDYLKEHKLPRQDKVSIEIIHQGKETTAFKKCFSNWDDKLFGKQVKLRGNNIFMQDVSIYIRIHKLLLV
ncbi:gelsolin repeat protein [Dictyocaulus viviparus]|uniref:Gelsolin repeat protein n=1 Tax=Dictyocaulus viviparus TaxID=29172 RepID=A0A0D8XKG2_DICVI|nr:gelsolin repeat protein [Dictyocaulus viviparus]